MRPPERKKYLIMAHGWKQVQILQSNFSILQPLLQGAMWEACGFLTP